MPKNFTFIASDQGAALAQEAADFANASPAGPQNLTVKQYLLLAIRAWVLGQLSQKVRQAGDTTRRTQGQQYEEDLDIE